MGSRAGEEGKEQREDHKIGEGHAQIEEGCAGNHQRQHHAPLLLIERRSDKGPHLIEHIGDSQQQRDVERQLHGDEKRGGHIGGDHLCPLGQGSQQRGGQQMIDLVGKADEQQEEQQDGAHSLEQTAAQLQQVSDQGLLVFTHDDFCSGGGFSVGSGSCGALAFSSAMAAAMESG